MATAEVHFHGELNDFQPRERQARPFTYTFDRRAAIKDVIEALDVPHTEVDIILINGQSVEFGAILHDGDRVAVYPWSTEPPVPNPQHLRPRPPAHPRFVLDTHLGRLARYLRLLGFDTRYRNDYSDPELAACADEEARILLTRDRGLLKRKRIALAHFVRNDDPWRQLEEICAQFSLHDTFAPFTRCAHCNGTLQPVDKARIIDRLAPKTRRYFDHFLQCDGCRQIYWEGSHVEHMHGLVARLKRHRGASG
ncbi:Mut7-C RNAse domain-containing protein [Aidingimonas lacisalsi]|uniref:Mut7-C RNAse domain-containing protein n=1 Tax=Aidingimonas lacisalsi TaxID=2604086 RepID=UPI0011D25C1A|nr:Mut7-C RNAse domain-containing protein [Aidingimonas lacisalsi]